MDTFLIAFITIILYILLLFLLRKVGFNMKKQCGRCMNCCPDCDLALSRIKRKISDYITHYLTFRIFDCRRYICSNCGWEGLRWEEKFTSKRH